MVHERKHCVCSTYLHKQLMSLTHSWHIDDAGRSVSMKPFQNHSTEFFISLLKFFGLLFKIQINAMFTFTFEYSSKLCVTTFISYKALSSHYSATSNQPSRNLLDYFLNESWLAGCWQVANEWDWKIFRLTVVEKNFSFTC